MTLLNCLPMLVRGADERRSRIILAHDTRLRSANAPMGSAIMPAHLIQ